MMAQAREGLFYTRLHVPDTVDGRFDMLTVHAFLLTARLRSGDAAAHALSQDVFDHMFRDMDQALREMGVGDMGIGKRIQKMASKFYGRARAYEAALAEPGDDALCAALGRNVYAGVAPPAAAVAQLAAYMRRACADLDAQPMADLMAGRVHFPAVGAA